MMHQTHVCQHLKAAKASLPRSQKTRSWLQPPFSWAGGQPRKSRLRRVPRRATFSASWPPPPPAAPATLRRRQNWTPPQSTCQRRNNRLASCPRLRCRSQSWSHQSPPRRLPPKSWRSRTLASCPCSFLLLSPSSSSSGISPHRNCHQRHPPRRCRTFAAASDLSPAERWPAGRRRWSRTWCSRQRKGSAGLSPAALTPRTSLHPAHLRGAMGAVPCHDLGPSSCLVTFVERKEKSCCKHQKQFTFFCARKKEDIVGVGFNTRPGEESS